jgi:hypothetical protein
MHHWRLTCVMEIPARRGYILDVKAVPLDKQKFMKIF